MLRLAVLGSGSGTNFQSIQDAIGAGSLPAQVVCVLSDVSSARILNRAQHASLPAYYVDCAPSKTKLEGAAEERVISLLREHRVELVVLAGFMRILKDGLLSAYAGRIINIHPSLLPAFPGLKAWKQALDYGVKITGCTVHFVDAGVDTGPIILQRAVDVLPGDTPESLHARIQCAEHEAYPEAIGRLIARDATR